MRFRDHYREPAEPEPARSAPARAPWERQPGEPDHAFEQFQVFLYSPAPSLAAFARERGTSPGLLRESYALSRAWAWLERRAALHTHLARASAEAVTEEAQDRARAAVTLARGLREHALASLEDKRSRNEFFDAKEILAAAKIAIELERLIDGEATTRIGVDLSGASPEALAALDAALTEVERAKAQGGAQAPARGTPEQAN